MKTVKTATLALTWALLSLACYGQVNLATVIGLVQDSSGAPVPGANVKVTNTATGMVRDTTSSAEGDYRVPALQPGEYFIAVTSNGMSAEKTSAFPLTVGQTRRFDFNLKVSATQESVTVSAAAAAVQSDTSTVRTTIESYEVVSLPLNGRDFRQLLELAPSTSGGRSELRTYLLNGSGFTQSFNHDPTTTPSIEGIQEFSFEQNMAPARFSQGAGGVVNINLKSGANAFHGTVFEFLRNNSLNARNFFSPAAPPKLQQNQFGGVVSGPVIRNKMFFMFNYEGLRERSGSVRTSTVATAKERAGDFTEGRTGIVYDPLAPLTSTGGRQPFPGNVIPQSRFHPFAVALLPYFPQPNYINPTGGTTNYLNGTANRNDVNQYNGRLDYSFNTSNTLAFSVANSFGNIFSPGAIPVVNDAVTVADGRTAILQFTHLFSPTFLSMTNLSFNRQIFAQDRYSTEPVASSLGIPITSPSVDGFPLVNIAGMAGLNNTYTSLPFGYSNNNWELRQELSKTHGRHNFSFGGGFNTINFNEQITTSPRGRTSFNGLYTTAAPGQNQPLGWGDFLLGHARQLEIDAGVTPLYARRKMFNWFFQDDWKVARRLTLNLGLRHELNAPWREHRNQAAYFDTGCGCMVYMQGAPLPAGFRPPFPIRTDGPTGLGPSNLKDFGPRFGFAFSPTVGGNTVLRGGYGIFYDVPVGQAIGVLGNAAPFRGNLLNQGSLTAPELRIPNDYPTLANLRAGQVSAFGIDPNYFPDPYVQQWNLTLERSLPGNLVASVGYVGTKGTRLMINMWPNIPAPGPGVVAERMPFPAFSNSIQMLVPAGLSNYHSLQATLNKRMSHGLFFQSSYAFGKSIDMRSDATGWAGQQDPMNARGNRGRSDFDNRHRVSLGFNYSLPVGRNRRFFSSAPWFADAVFGGWNLGGIMVARSGSPFTVGSPSGTLNNGTPLGRRANRIADGRLSSDERTIYRWFSTLR